MRIKLKKVHIYDNYFEKMDKIPNNKLMKNKENGKGRPTVYFKHPNNKDLLIAVPLSSQNQKYEAIIEQKKKKHEFSKSIVITKTHEKKDTFLIQNMFPIRKKNIRHVHKNKGKVDALDGKAVEILYDNVMETYERYKRGEKVLFTKFNAMEKVLMKEIELEKSQEKNKIAKENKNKSENLQYNISTGKIYQGKLAKDLDKEAKNRKYSKGEWITDKDLNNGITTLKSDEEKSVKLKVFVVRNGKSYKEIREFYNKEQLNFTKTQEQNLKAPNFKELEERKSHQEKNKEKSLDNGKGKEIER